MLRTRWVLSPSGLPVLYLYGSTTTTKNWKNPWFYSFVFLNNFFLNWCKCTYLCKKSVKKNLGGTVKPTFCCILKVTEEKSSRIWIRNPAVWIRGSGSESNVASTSRLMAKPDSGSGSIEEKRLDPQFHILYGTCAQCCGSGIRCLFDPWIRDPGWVESQHPDPGSGTNNPDHIF